MTFSGRMVTGGPHHRTVSFKKLHVYSHYVHVYKDICSLIAYKMLLENGSTAETSWENKGKNLRFDFSFI